MDADDRASIEYHLTELLDIVDRLPGINVARAARLVRLARQYINDPVDRL